ncbi:hypothetical protein F4703DRAFT_1939035 [Phycomyces blakesleeanus]
MSLLVAEKLEKSPKAIDAGASFIWAHNNDENLEQTSRLFARMIAKEIGMEEVARKEDLVQHDMARFYAEPDPHEGETVANAPECIILSLGWREKVMGIALQGLSSPVVVITLTTACSERFSSQWIKGVFRGYPTTWYLSLVERLGVKPFDRMDTGTLSVLATAQICYQ